MRSSLSFLVVNMLYGCIVASIVVRSLWFEGKGGLVPLVIGVPTAVLILLAVLSRLKATKREPEPASSDGEVASWKGARPVVAWLGVLMLLILFMGFYPSLFLFTFAYMRFSARVSYAISLVMSGGLLLLIYGSFEWVLQRPLFEGLFFGAVMPLL